MRIHRFFVAEKIGTKESLTIHSADLTNQIRRVFRLKNGDEISIFDGSGFEYECKITDLKIDSIELAVVSIQKSAFVPQKNITLYAAIVKKDNFEWIVQKATELGVTRIVPVLSERSEKKSLNEERLKKIAIEASEQSGRGNIPIMSGIQTLSDACPKSGIVFHTDGEILPQHVVDGAENINLFIGPEGGWSDSELELFKKNNIQIYSLGRQTFRTETAVIVALSKFL